LSQTSYNGWPASKDPDEIRIRSFQVRGTKVKLRAAKRCGPLLAAFAADFHELIEPIDEGRLDDWSFAYRPVRGLPDKLSCHASGSAIDLNALAHPLGKAGTFPAEKIPMLQGLCRKYGIKWGGDFRGRKDEQHFEIQVKPKKAAKLIKRLGLEKSQ
jgi:hypothetical protein